MLATFREWRRQYPEWKRQFDDWRRRPGPLISMVIVLAITGLAGGTYVLRDTPGNCGGKPLLLSVAATADIARSMLDVAARFNIQTHEVRGQCVRIDVQEHTSVSMARRVSGLSSKGDNYMPSAWVPDSSMWLNVARSSGKGAEILSSEATSIATSPVVLAAPKQVADGLRKRKTKPSWRMMFPEYAELFGGRTSKAGVSVAMLDPVNSSSGIAAVIAARQVIGEHRRAPELLTTFVRNVQNSVSSDPWGLFTYLTGLASTGRPVVVATEHEVVDYNETHRRKPATALVPDEGTIVLDYPFVVTTKDPALREAAEAFRFQLQSELARQTMQRAGFRNPAGIPDQDIARKYGLAQQPPKQLIWPTSGQVNEALQSWNRLGLGSRILVLTDVSASMSQLVPGRFETRMQVAINAALTGLQLFPDDTDIGLWTFASNVDGPRDYKQLMSLGPITQKLDGKLDRRRTLQRLAPQIRPVGTDAAGLYDSILAGYRHVRSTWKPDKFNAVLVFTDGSNKGGKLSLQQLLERLRAESDPQHPLQVIIVAFGPDVDLAPMQQIARVTNGSTYSATDPGQIVNVFMEAIGRRLCTPNCPRQ
jgi:ABC-type Fe3+ transport system substrate-binding protein